MTKQVNQDTSFQQFSGPFSRQNNFIELDISAFICFKILFEIYTYYTEKKRKRPYRAKFPQCNISFVCEFQFY